MPPPGLSFPISTGRRAGGTRKAPPLPPAAPSPTDLLCLPSQSPASGPPGRSGHVQDGGLEAWGAREAFRPLRPRPGLPLPPTARPAPSSGSLRPPLHPGLPSQPRRRSPVRSTHTPPDLSFLPPRTPRRRGGGGQAEGRAGGAADVEAGWPPPPSRVQGQAPPTAPPEQSPPRTPVSPGADGWGSCPPSPAQGR